MMSYDTSSAAVATTTTLAQLPSMLNNASARSTQTNQITSSSEERYGAEQQSLDNASGYGVVFLILSHQE